jgi:hypothetical protein
MATRPSGHIGARRDVFRRKLIYRRNSQHLASIAAAFPR